MKDDNAPADLPGAVVEVRTAALAKARDCPDCGQEGRVVSNHLGVTVHCGRCKASWPVSGPRAVYAQSVLPPRGLHKVTFASPDVEEVFSLEEEEQHENKRRFKKARD